MAVTISFTTDTRGRQRVGRQRQVTGRMTLSGTYATNGFTVAASDFGVSLLDSLELGTPWEAGEGYTTAWDSANSKVKLYWGNNDGVADTAFVEVANTTDVTGVLIAAIARGV